jgi:DNA (cytosine-5)-methyltransferase 1
MSLGFEQAGFDVAAAVEIDPVHCAVHKFNFPRTAVIPRSVERLSGREIRIAAGIGNRPVDCVFGGAPCQGFSLIGHRVLDDPRNSLVLDFVRIVAELDARAFETRGYDVRLPWRVLNAGNFGTPQSRERLILFGAKKGSPLPVYPDPATSIPGRRGATGLTLGPTCAEALDDLPDAEGFAALLDGDSAATDRYGPPSRYAAELRCLGNEAWHYGHPRLWNPSVLTSSARTDHTEISRRRFSETVGGEVEPISRLFKLPAGGVSNTLRAGTDGARGAFTSPRPIHHRYPRCVTVREMARLHGFPDWFRFNATKWHGARQIGNAVPPPLARAVAAQVIAALGIAPSRPAEALPLGDPALLAMDVSTAAAHFGIAPPKTGRDRKSGAKKRKQAEIEAERIARVAYG